MNKPPRTVEWLAWGGLAVVIAAIAAAFVYSQTRPDVPPVPVLGPVADFTLTNQNGQVTTLAGLRGRVWVADIIFTRCAGPCPRMTQQMKSLQDALPAGGQTQCVTLTTDPDFDTPPVLQKYANRFGADPARWTFLTGSKMEIAGLAIDSLKLTAVERLPAERADAADLFVHSTIFVVVDRRARLRGVFETGGEGVDWEKSKADILAMMKQLEREP